MKASHELISTCKCSFGCPACCHISSCGDYNEHTDKILAKSILASLLGYSNSSTIIQNVDHIIEILDKENLNQKDTLDIFRSDDSIENNDLNFESKNDVGIKKVVNSKRKKLYSNHSNKKNKATLNGKVV